VAVKTALEHLSLFGECLLLFHDGVPFVDEL